MNSTSDSLIIFSQKLARITPKIFLACCVDHDEFKKHVYAKLILSFIHSSCTIRTDVANIYKWMGLPAREIFDMKYSMMNFIEFYDKYSSEDKGFTILNKIVDDFEMMKVQEFNK